MCTGRRVALLCCGLCTVWGCAPRHPPAPNAPTSYPWYVGDRGRVEYDEMVVSLPLRGADTPYQNLHVRLTVFVNPARESATAGFETQGIVKRSEERVAMRLLDVLGGLGEQSLDGTATLRQRIAAEAQAVVDDVMKQWTHGSEYRVEVAVTRLYWTDPSVGAPPPKKRFPWE